MKRFVLFMIVSIVAGLFFSSFCEASVKSTKTQKLSAEQFAQVRDIDIVKQFISRMQAKRYDDARKLIDHQGGQTSSTLQLAKRVPSSFKVVYYTQNVCCGVTSRAYFVSAKGVKLIALMNSKGIELVCDYAHGGDGCLDVWECNGGCIPEALLSKLPYDTIHFLVEENPEGEGIQITIFATLNVLTEKKYAEYEKQLKVYKAEVIKWLRPYKLDPKITRISWIPEQAVKY